MEQKFKFYFLWLSLACIIVFILQNLIPGITGLFLLNRSAIYNFEIWRFFSAIFLHEGILHIALNLFALLFFGLILEKRIGSRNFLILFLSSGIIANIIAVNFYSSSLGASGVIYGILGCLIVIEPFAPVFSFGILIPMFLAGILYIIGNILESLGAFGLTNTGNIAHLSGIAVGIIFGFLFWKYRKKNIKKEKVIIPKDYLKEWEEKYMK